MRTRRRSRQQSVIVIVATLAFACAATMLALTRSTTQTAPSGGAVSPLDLTPPYNEMAELAASGYGATPDETLDLKKSAGQTVTIDMVRRQQKQAAAVPAAATGIAWQQLGPYNIGGRMSDVVALAGRPNTVIGAAASGGLWKSTDGGANWTSIWPDENVQAMGAVAEAPDGTLWAGTGEANPPGGGLTYFGDGIYKSTDDGATWQHMGLPDSAAFGRIAVDPTNSNRVFAAAAGHIARSVRDRGIYRTEDGGKTWERVIAPTTPSTGGIDIEIHPTNPDIVYAALWDHRRTNGTRIYGGVGSGLFRSKDGGDTWERLENIVDPLPDYDTTKTGLKSDASLGRIGIALAPSNPNRLYVVAGGPTGPDKGFYFSDDGGDTLHVGGRAYAPNGGFQWWFGKIWVDPEDQNHIFNADVSLRRSTDGGMTWSAVGNSGNGRVGIHADQQAMDFDKTTIDGDPSTPVRVFLGNDGGMWRSDADGAPNTWDKATNQPWNQSYHLAVSPFDWKRQIVGLQDNGSNKSWVPTEPSPADPELRDWSGAGGGDGHYNAIDPHDDRIYYTCSQSSGAGRHSCTGRRDTATGTTTFTIAQTNVPGQRYTTDAPIVIDPNTPPLAEDGSQPPNALYIGGNYVLRSLNRGTAFDVISPVDTTPNDPTDPTDALPGPILEDEIDIGLYTNLYGAVTTVAPAKSATPVPYAQVIYAGTDTGLVWKTENAGQTWTRMEGLPTRWVNKIVVDPDDANHAYVGFSGFRQGDDAAHVYETKDGGASWQNVSHNMPNGPVEMLEYDPRGNVLFAGTDVGVFVLKDGDTSWYKISVGLPNAPMLDLKLSGDGKHLVVATFGRSNFVLPLFTDAVDGGGPGGSAGGTVPATLSLEVGSASFPAFTPGTQREYEATTTANVISTAGDATLSVSDPGHLANGAFSLPEPLRVELSKASWTEPVSNDPVEVTFKQLIKADDALRTGTYSKTVTFTLSTTNP
jgi:photosystem II stability/assembly factor-like uncharacterized protein